MGSIKGKQKEHHCPKCGKTYMGSLYSKTESLCDECKGNKKKPKEIISNANIDNNTIEFEEIKDEQGNVVHDVFEKLNDDYNWQEEMQSMYNKSPDFIKEYCCPLCGRKTHPIHVVKTFYNNLYEMQCNNKDCGMISTFMIPTRQPVSISKALPRTKFLDWSGHIKDFGKSVSDSSFEHFITSEYEKWIEDTKEERDNNGK